MVFPKKGHVTVDTPGGSQISLVMALSVRASEYQERFDWALENDFALEYTPDPLHPELISEHVQPYVERGLPVRFHTRFFDFELGNADKVKADTALQIHLAVIDAIKGIGEPVITVHLNLSKSKPFDPDIAVKNLSALVQHAERYGITVCLENLKKGPTSLPDNILSWSATARSMITMDMGHAISSDYVAEGKSTVPAIIDRFGPKLLEVHMYAKEEDRHYPITDIAMMTESLDRLLLTKCRWWTIELDYLEEALATRDLLLKYLNTKIRKENQE